jgi:hypothetical protein
MHRMGRLEKKLRQKARHDAELQKMISTLESVWRRPVKYTCENCLREAYCSVVNNVNGYVTDDELIISSKNTLRHK